MRDQAIAWLDRGADLLGGAFDLLNSAAEWLLQQGRALAEQIPPTWQAEVTSALVVTLAASAGLSLSWIVQRCASERPTPPADAGPSATPCPRTP